VEKSSQGLLRHLFVTSYRVARVRRFSAAGEVFATLHVESLGDERGDHRLGLLGLSRDLQPFALVALDESREHALEMGRWRAAEPARCGETHDPSADRAMKRCGALLAGVASDEAMLQALVAGIERHELQHQIDGPLLPVARVVLDKLAGYADEAQERVNRELSAYLAQLTTTGPGVDGGVKSGLVLPLRHALLGDRGTYHHAAVLTLEALAWRSIRSPSGEVDSAAAADAFDALADLGDDELRQRASAAWSRLFDDDLVSVTLLDESITPEGEAQALR
jgi:hypothetical protein